MTAPFIKSVTLRGFLSFPPEGVTLSMAPLNVLIGPNGSGKSNFIEALALLRAVPKDLPLPVRQGGGVREWLYRGEQQATRAEIDVVFGEGHVAYPPTLPPPAVRYHLAFGVDGESFVVLDERLENESGKPKPYFYFGYENGRPMVNVAGDKRELRREDVDPAQSILSQRRDPDTYPEITRLADRLGRIRTYREWAFGPDSPIRQSSRADVRADGLSEALDNLPTRLAVLKRDPAVKRELLARLGDVAPGFTDLEVVPEGGRLQLYLTEGRHNVPAHRLSDGTLRYLALLAILLDPTPPPLIVIEEPELGLHFDIMPKIAQLLGDASARAQLVVTTHSDVLVDALQDAPERVVVCEKGDGGTTLRRLDAAPLAKWLTKYSLGTLWTRGQLGGTRW